MCSSYKFKYIININILLIMITSLLAINDDHAIDENQVIQPSIENLLAEAFVHGGDILLNVTWNSNVKDDQLFDVTVEPVQQNIIKCPRGTCMENSINGTEVVLPKPPYVYVEPFNCKIEFNCQYNILVKLVNSYFQTNFIYTVPDCVDNLCSCSYASNLPNTTLTVNYKPPEINISWILNKSNKILPMGVDITNIRIKISELSNPSLSWGAHNVNLENITQPLTFPNGSTIYKGFHRTILKEQIKPDHGLIITTNVEDNRRCSGKTSNFTRIERAVLKNDSRQSDESTNYKLLVIIILPIIIIIIIVSIALQRYRRKIRKENAIQNWRGVYHNVPSGQTGGVPAHIAMEDNFLYVDKDILDARSRGEADLLEIPHSCLTIGREIGKGAFGRVFIARADNIGGKLGSQVVAVKKLKKRPSPDELEEFLSEITTMKTVSRHPNVVSLIGCCTIKQPLLMIMEFVGCGDLLHYLRQVRTKHEARSTAVSGIVNPQHTQIVNNNNIITLSNQNLNLEQQQQQHQQQQQQKHQHQQQQQQQQQQTILGPFGKYLELLHSSNSGTSNSDASYVTQPDSMTSTVRPSVTETLYTTLSQNPELASLTGSSIEYVLDHKELHKFAFQIARGMRHLEERQITHRDLAARNILIDENKTLKISDFGLSRSGIYVNTRKKKVPLRWLSLEAIRDNLYSSKSDVWAFGIVLWEIGTLGGFPYPTVDNHELLQYLNSGQRLQRPENCSEQLYDLMLQCWAEKPEDRPQFSDIVTKLEPSNQKIYVDFNELGADYIFPPTAEPLRYRNAPTLNN